MAPTKPDLFAHLARKGIILPESIQGGSYYGALWKPNYKKLADGPKLNAAKFALVKHSRDSSKEEKPYLR